MGNFSAKEEKVFESKFIKPGIHDNIKIEEFELKTNDSNGTEYIVLKLSKGDLTTEENLSFSDAAKDWSIDKLSHMYNRFYVPQGWLDFSATASSLQEVVNFFNKNLKGKVFKQVKFSGKEVKASSADKKNWWKAVIGLPSFCSTEFAPKALTFNEVPTPNLRPKEKGYNYDMVALPVADANPVNVTVENSALPF